MQYCPSCGTDHKVREDFLLKGFIKGLGQIVTGTGVRTRCLREIVYDVATDDINTAQDLKDARGRYAGRVIRSRT